MARVLLTHSLLEGLLLTFQQGQETGSQTKERGTEEQTQGDRQEKRHSQSGSDNWLNLQTLGRTAMGIERLLKLNIFTLMKPTNKRAYTSPIFSLMNNNNNAKARHPPPNLRNRALPVSLNSL